MKTASPIERLAERVPFLRRFARPLRFGIVGASGAIINTSILWLLARLVGLAVPIASVIATEAAIISNFLLNDGWTFRAAERRHPVWMRFLRYNGVALGGLVITAGVLTLLTSYLGMPLLPANIIAILCAMTWNYIINARWTWRDTPGHVVRQSGE